MTKEEFYSYMNDYLCDNLMSRIKSDFSSDVVVSLFIERTKDGIDIYNEESKDYLLLHIDNHEALFVVISYNNFYHNLMEKYYKEQKFFELYKNNSDNIGD